MSAYATGEFEDKWRTKVDQAWSEPRMIPDRSPRGAEVGAASHHLATKSDVLYFLSNFAGLGYDSNDFVSISWCNTQHS